jgi:hypothetical protein
LPDILNNISLYKYLFSIKAVLELRIPTPATTMTWYLGLAITAGFIEKLEKNVKVNCDKYKCCDNMH